MSKGQLAASEVAKESLHLELEGKFVAMETQLQRYVCAGLEGV